MKLQKLCIARLVVALVMPAGSLVAQGVPAPSSQPAGSVTGVVRSVDGTPAQGVRITALRADAVDDAVRAMASLTQTDSTGRYRLENIPPGRYYVTAGRVDLPTYYPGTLDVTKGTAISITSAGVVSDIDFVILDTSATPPPGRGLRGRGGPAPANLTGLIGVLTRQQQLQNGPTNQFQGGRRGPGPTNPTANPVPPLPAAPAGATSPGAAWWTNAALVARLGLTEEQKKKIEGVFEQYRQSLVQSKADLDREEGVLARMLEAETLEPAKVSSQIDRVVQARAEMERTNSRMTLDMRQNLTRAQWVQLQAETAQPAVPAVAPAFGRGRGGGPGLRGGTPPSPAPAPAPLEVK